MPRYEHYDDYRYDQPKKKKKKKGGGFVSFLTSVLLVAAIGTFGFSAWKLVGYYQDYKAGSDEYDDLAEQYAPGMFEEEGSKKAEAVKSDGGAGGEINQAGNGEGTGLNQSGSGAGGEISQAGNGEGTGLNQSGSGAGGEISQAGNGEGAGLNQSGSGAGGEISQAGNGEGAGLSQSGSGADGLTRAGAKQGDTLTQAGTAGAGDLAQAGLSESDLARLIKPGEVLDHVWNLENPLIVPFQREAAKHATALENGEIKSLPVMKNPINFDKLQEKNADIIGWIRLGSLKISYPIAQGADNDYYLHRTFERQDNFAGCIFLNCDNSRFFTDQNSIVYGHNMKNGSMFGTLKKLQDQKLYESNPYFWIFTPDMIYQYRIFATSTVSAVGDRYDIRFTDENFMKFVEECRNNSYIKDPDLNITEKDRVVTLSTCTGDASTRFVVHGVVEQVYLADGSKLARTSEAASSAADSE